MELQSSVEPVTAVTCGVGTLNDAEGSKRCICCELSWPITFDYFRPAHIASRAARGLPPTFHPNCRSCEGGASGENTTRARKSRGAITAAEAADRALAYFRKRKIKQANLADRPIARELGIRRRDMAQTDISIECHKAGIEPGRDLRKRQLPAEPSQVVEERQERFERHEAQPPKESRQVRRARERRLVKDARAAFTRQLTDAETTALAIDRAMSARTRASGKPAAPRVRTHKAVRWNLTPTEVGEILKAQGYRCALTGEPFKATTEYGSSNPFSPSPNRIEPGGDYVPENCEFVCWWANRLISDMPREKALEFLSTRKLLRKDFQQPSFFR